MILEFSSERLMLWIVSRMSWAWKYQLDRQYWITTKLEFKTAIAKSDITDKDKVNYTIFKAFCPYVMTGVHRRRCRCSFMEAFLVQSCWTQLQLPISTKFAVIFQTYTLTFLGRRCFCVVSLFRSLCLPRCVMWQNGARYAYVVFRSRIWMRSRHFDWYNFRPPGSVRTTKRERVYLLGGIGKSCVDFRMVHTQTPLHSINTQNWGS